MALRGVRMLVAMTERSDDTRFTPDGWHTVTTRIVVQKVPQFIEFLERVFGATGNYRPDLSTVMLIGDSMVMISDAGIRQPVAAFLYVYVSDADEIYRRAIEAEATSVEEPSVMPYGDRRGMVEDAWENIWQIATYARK